MNSFEKPGIDVETLCKLAGRRAGRIDLIRESYQQPDHLLRWRQAFVAHPIVQVGHARGPLL